MAGIRIPFIAEVSDFLRGKRSVTEGLEDVVDSLDDVGDAGEDLERKFKDVFDTVQRDSKRAGKDMGDSITDGARRAGEGVDDFKDEANSTAREAAASFDGSAESIGDAFQEVAANAFAGFGPAGAAAGLAAAAGIGLAIQSLQQAADEANELTQDAVELSHTLGDPDMAARAADLADRWTEVTEAISDARSIWEVWQPRATTLIEDFAAASSNAAFDVEALYDAFNDPNPVTRLAGMKKALEELREVEQEEARKRNLAQKDVFNQSQRAREAVEKEIATQEAAVEILEAKARAVGMTTEEYQANEEATARAADVQQSYNAALEDAGDAVSVYEGVLERKQTAEQNAAEATAAATEDSADSWQDYATEVTVTTQDLIDEWTRQAEAARTFEANLATIAAAGGQVLADELRKQGPEVAGATADLIAKAGPEEQRAAIAAHAAATGAEVGRGISTGLSSEQQTFSRAIEGFVKGIPVPSITVKPTLDTRGAEADLQAWLRRERELLVNARGRLVV